jgi:hypothetical protein
MTRRLFGAWCTKGPRSASANGVDEVPGIANQATSTISIVREIDSSQGINLDWVLAAARERMQTEFST